MEWFEQAKKYIGTKEIKGQKHNSTILRWWAAIRAPFTDDETPWCAAFVGGVLEECGIKSSRSASARSYMKWGRAIPHPVLGCIVVFWRNEVNSSFGHVGFVAGVDQRGNLMVLGGNQKDAVNMAPFSKKRVLTYRWPENKILPASLYYASLPVIRNFDPVSVNES